MASSVELKQYRITKVDYVLTDDYNSTLQIEPTIRFWIPSDHSAHLRCEYTLKIKGDPQEVFSLAITADGIFDVPELPLLPDGDLDTSKTAPVTAIMEQKLIASVTELTKEFGISPLELEVVPTKNEKT